MPRRKPWTFALDSAVSWQSHEQLTLNLAPTKDVPDGGRRRTIRLAIPPDEVDGLIATLARYRDAYPPAPVPPGARSSPRPGSPTPAERSATPPDAAVDTGPEIIRGGPAFTGHVITVARRDALAHLTCACDTFSDVVAELEIRRVAREHLMAATGHDLCPCAIPWDDPLYSGHARSAHDGAKAAGCDGQPTPPCGGCVNCAHIAHLTIERDRPGARPGARPRGCGGALAGHCVQAEHARQARAHMQVTADRRVAEAGRIVDVLLTLCGAAGIQLPERLDAWASELARLWQHLDQQREDNRRAYVAFLSGVQEIEEALSHGVLTHDQAWSYVLRVRDAAVRRFRAEIRPPGDRRPILRGLAQQVRAALTATELTAAEQTGRESAR